jgi:hypothetical protein
MIAATFPFSGNTGIGSVNPHNMSNRASLIIEVPNRLSLPSLVS